MYECISFAAWVHHLHSMQRNAPFLPSDISDSVLRGPWGEGKNARLFEKLYVLFGKCISMVTVAERKLTHSSLNGIWMHSSGLIIASILPFYQSMSCYVPCICTSISNGYTSVNVTMSTTTSWWRWVVLRGMKKRWVKWRNVPIAAYLAAPNQHPNG